jgi:hypothetical protein
MTDWSISETGGAVSTLRWRTMRFCVFGPMVKDAKGKDTPCCPPIADSGILTFKGRDAAASVIGTVGRRYLSGRGGAVGLIPSALPQTKTAPLDCMACHRVGAGEGSAHCSRCGQIAANWKVGGSPVRRRIGRCITMPSRAVAAEFSRSEQ